MNKSTILTVEQDSVLYVSLNRPELHNAFNPEMIAALTDVFTSIGEPIRALILRGEGPSFSAGADLNWMESMIDYKLKENVADSRKLFEMFEAGLNCPCPIVGRLHGHVMGGAIGLVAICDVAIAELTTRFCFSEVKLGLAPAVISPFVLHKMNKSRVSEWMLTGRSFGSDEAKEAGLIQYVGCSEDVDKIIEKILDRFFQSGKEAVRATKKLINSYLKSSWSEMEDEVTRTIAERRVSDEGQEGLRSFLEKREARWKVSRQ